MNKFWIRTGSIVVALLLSTVSVSGCSNFSPDSNNSTNSATQNANLSAATAASTATGYYTTWFTVSQKDYANMVSTVDKIIGDKAGDRSKASEDPVGYISSLPPTTQAKLSTQTGNLNRSLSYFDTKNLSEAQKTTLNIMNMSLGGLFATSDASKVKVTVDKNKIKVDDKNKTATVPFSAVSITNGDEGTTFTDTEGIPLKLTGKSGTWKIDGKAWLDSVLKASNATATASPSAAASPSPSATK